MQEADPRGGAPADPLTSTLQQGKCYALLVASQRRVAEVRLLVAPRPAVGHPGRLARHSAIARHCATQDSEVRAIVTLERAGNFVWALFSRPVDVTDRMPADPAARRARRARRPARQPALAPSLRPPRRDRHDRPAPYRPPSRRRGWSPHDEF